MKYFCLSETSLLDCVAGLSQQLGKESSALTSKVNITRTIVSGAGDWHQKCAWDKVLDELCKERARVSYRYFQVIAEESASCICGTNLSQRESLLTILECVRALASGALWWQPSNNCTFR